MLKTLSSAEGDGNSQPPTPRKVSVFGVIEFGLGGAVLGLIAFVLLLVTLNYFNILSLSKMNPKLFSLLPTSVPVPGSCKVLEEKFCPQAERVIVNVAGTQVEYLGFKDIPANSPIYSPFDGTFFSTNEDDLQLSGNRILIRKNTADGGADIRGVIRVDTAQRNIKSKEVIGYKSVGKTLDNSYDLLITITKRASNAPIVDEDSLRQLAPKAFEKPAKQISP